MCGIFGAIGARGLAAMRGVSSSAPGLREPALHAALDTLAHRGPDGAGASYDPDHDVFLAQRRLAIIDLSSGGEQPMTNEDGSLHLTYNGEIYNFAELRAGLVERGHRFRGHCDAEVVLHLYEEKGMALLDDLVGMFAFALYDANERALFLARDRLGIKPLYWYHDPATFAFASELKAIRSLPGLDLAPDVTAYYDYLTYRFVPSPKTIYARASKLPAGHYLELRGGEPRVRRWWDLSFEPREELDFEAALEELHPLAETVVRDHLVSDVEVGAFLSSGVDSSLVTALARGLRDGAAPRTFTVSFPERHNDEAAGARGVADLLGARQDVSRFGIDEVATRADALFDLFDEPFADHAALPLMDLSRLAAEHVKVVLSGDGGDETHAGYGRYDKGPRRDRVYDLFAALPGLGGALLRAPTRRLPWARDVAEVPEGRRHAFHAGFPRTTKSLFLSGIGSELADYDDYWLLRENARREQSALARQQRLDIVSLLPDGHLTKVDRVSMRFGLEVRVPLLDHRMVEFAAALPDGLRRRDGEGKPLLRALLAAVLPGYDTATPKMGFSLPLKHFVAERGLFRLEGDIEVFDAFRVDRARALDTLSPRKNAMELWQLWVLDAFLRKHERGPVAPDASPVPSAGSDGSSAGARAESSPVRP